MFAHNGKAHNAAPHTDQINCAVALVTAETKGSVSLIVAATSGWLPSHFSPDLEASPHPKNRERTLFHIPQVAPKWPKTRRGWEGVMDLSFAKAAQKWRLSLHTPQGDLLSP